MICTLLLSVGCGAPTCEDAPWGPVATDEDLSLEEELTSGGAIHHTLEVVESSGGGGGGGDGGDGGDGGEDPADWSVWDLVEEPPVADRLISTRWDDLDGIEDWALAQVGVTLGASSDGAKADAQAAVGAAGYDTDALFAQEWVMACLITGTIQADGSPEVDERLCAYPPLEGEPSATHILGDATETWTWQGCGEGRLCTDQGVIFSRRDAPLRELELAHDFIAIATAFDMGATYQALTQLGETAPYQRTIYGTWASWDHPDTRKLQWAGSEREQDEDWACMDYDKGEQALDTDQDGFIPAAWPYLSLP